MKLDRKAVLVTVGIAGVVVTTIAFVSVVLLLSRRQAYDDGVNGLVLAYCGLAVVSALYSLSQLRRGRVGLFTLAIAHVFWFAWPAFQVVSGGRRWGDLALYPLSNAVVAKTSWLMIGFLVLNLATYFCCRRRGRTSSPGVPPAPGPIPSAPVLGILFVAGLLPFMLFGGGPEDVLRQIMTSRAGASSKGWKMGAHIVNANGPIVVIGRSSMVAFCGMAIWVTAFRGEAMRTRTRIALVLAAVVGGLITWFDSGTRTWTLLLVGPALIGMLVKQMGQRRFVKGATLGVTSLTLLVMLVQAQRFYRFHGSFDRIHSGAVIWVDDNDFYTETAIAVDLVPRRHAFLEEVEIAHFLTNPIPRVWWPQKPVSQSIRIFSLGRSGFDEYTRLGTSRLPSLVGQHWMSFGLWGVVFAGVAWGFGFAAFERLYLGSEPRSMMAFVAMLACLWLFALGRGAYPGFHYPVLISSLLVAVSTRRADWRGLRSGGL